MALKATQKSLIEALSSVNLKQSLSICVVAVSFYLLVSSVESKSSTLGIHPLDEKYFAAEVIKCKDGSKSFNRDRLNDDFCDCIDGTDEPGTSACPAGKFYCGNVGSMPQFIFSSRVNDHVCDCCDGSDEYGSGIMCPNTCIMGGNFEYKSEDYISTSTHLHSTKVKQRKGGINLEDLIEMIAGLRMILIAEMAFICFLVVQWKRVRSKRRHYQ